MIAERRAGNGAGKGDMLDVLLDAGLPEADVMYTLVDLFVAGVNTVSTALEWMLLIQQTVTSGETCRITTLYCLIARWSSRWT